MIKSAMKDCASLVEAHVESKRIKSIALMKVEEAVLWANQDIARQIADLEAK